MTTLHRTLRAAALVAATLVPSSVAAQQATRPTTVPTTATPTPPSAGTAPGTYAPRYLAQIQTELTAMGMAPQCNGTSATVGTCTVRVAGGTGSTAPAAGAPAANAAARSRNWLLGLRYDDGSDTIYVYLDHYGTLRSDATTAAQAFRRLMELNWEMLVGKFEWSPSSGEVRLSATINTDSNFDRRAFRGVVRALLRLADRYADEVARVTGSPVGDAAPAARPAGPTAPPSAAAPAH